MSDPYGSAAEHTVYLNSFNLGCGLPRHGASVEINDRGHALFHIDKYGIASQPIVESFPDGIRVGCTFVSSDAIEKIYRYHQKFLKQETSCVHQAGTK